MIFLPENFLFRNLLSFILLNNSYYDVKVPCYVDMCKDYLLQSDIFSSEFITDCLKLDCL